LTLQSIDASGCPLAGEHNFYKGGSLAVYDEEARNAIDNNRAIFIEVIVSDRECLG